MHSSIDKYISFRVKGTVHSSTDQYSYFDVKSTVHSPIDKYSSFRVKSTVHSSTDQYSSFHVQSVQSTVNYSTDQYIPFDVESTLQSSTDQYITFDVKSALPFCSFDTNCKYVMSCKTYCSKKKYETIIFDFFFMVILTIQYQLSHVRLLLSPGEIFLTTTYFTLYKISIQSFHFRCFYFFRSSIDEFAEFAGVEIISD